MGRSLEHDQTFEDAIDEEHRSTIGVVGLGAMGGAMATRLLSAGYGVVGYDVREERIALLAAQGVQPAASASEVGSRAERVITSVFDGEQLMHVARGLLECGDRVRTVVDTSTVDPRASSRVASVLEAAGKWFLRAPVSGSTLLAANGALTFMCSGSVLAYDECADLLDVLGAQKVYVGRAEEARSAKLAINLMVAGTMAMFAEALGMLEGAGIDRELAYKLIESSVVGSSFLAYKREALLRDDFRPIATVALIRKDIALAREAATLMSLQLPVTAAVDRELARCQERGEAGLDFSVLVRLRRGHATPR